MTKTEPLSTKIVQGIRNVNRTLQPINYDEIGRVCEKRKLRKRYGTFLVEKPTLPLLLTRRFDEHLEKIHIVNLTNISV